MRIKMRISNILKNSRNLIYFHNLDQWPKGLLENMMKYCSVREEFITGEEEISLLKEIEPHMKRLRYEKSHWDDAIYLFREREQRRWNKDNEGILKKIKEASFSPETMENGYIHLLDLHKDGHIKPHIDSVRYCGDIITGISLISDSVMRLRHKDDEHRLILDLLLKRRSLYKLTGPARYDFKHEILGEEESFFGEQKVRIPRERRISVICRDMPVKEQPNVKLEMKPLILNE